MPPDINKSFTEFKVENDGIRFGLGALKHVGTGLIDSIVEEREKNGKFKDIEDFSRTLSNGEKDNVTKNHAYQIIGLIAGEKNEVTLELLDADGEEIATKEFTVDLRNVKVNGQKKLKVKDGDSKEELANGLYSMLGNDSDDQDYLALYDNDGT